MAGIAAGGTSSFLSGLLRVLLYGCWSGCFDSGVSRGDARLEDSAPGSACRPQSDGEWGTGSAEPVRVRRCLLFDWWAIGQLSIPGLVSAGVVFEST